jgi:hypothetical protein
MEDEAQAKILQLVNVISVEVSANRIDTSELSEEMRAGFGRVERRLGNLEVRVENVETELRTVQTDLRSSRRIRTPNRTARALSNEEVVSQPPALRAIQTAARMIKRPAVHGIDQSGQISTTPYATAQGV